LQRLHAEPRQVSGVYFDSRKAPCACDPQAAPKPAPSRLSPDFAVLAKSLWCENLLGNQRVRTSALESDISEFESSHPSHGVGSARSTGRLHRRSSPSLIYQFLTMMG
jgi:hypothetical protein